MVPIDTAGQIIAFLILGAHYYHNKNADIENAKTPSKIVILGTNGSADRSRQGYLVKKLQGNTTLNMEYLNKENLITVDTQVHTSQNHIQANPTNCTLTISDIATLYLQFTGTICEPKLDKSFIAQRIKKNLHSVRPGGHILIEWLPSVHIDHYYTMTEGTLHTAAPDKNITNDRTADPFTGFFDDLIIKNAASLAMGEKLPNTYSPSLVSEIQQLALVINNIFKFYEEKGLASQANLKQRLNIELEILNFFDSPSGRNGLPIDRIYLYEASIKQFNDNRNLIIEPLQEHQRSYMCKDKKPTIDTFASPLMQASDFWPLSLVEQLKKDLTVCTNTHLVLERLKKLDLEHGIVYYGTSPVSGHTNVPLISCFKKKE